jgi:hypothetical protein
MKKKHYKFQVSHTTLEDPADPDPGSGAFLTPRSGMGYFRIPFPKPIFLRAYCQLFWQKVLQLFVDLLNFFLYHTYSKKKIEFFNICGYKKS